MAVLKLVNNPCDTEDALRNLCHYVVRMDRTMGNVGGRGVRASAAYEDFCMAQSLWGRTMEEERIISSCLLMIWSV